MPRILVTRFNNETWNQNVNYRIKHGICGYIYPSPRRIKETIPIQSYVIVLEMNNETNQVIGISRVRNYVMADKYYHVYSDRNYNRFVYRGKERIDRTAMSKREEDVMKIWDALLFKGCNHMKRGSGFWEVKPERYKELRIGEEGIDTYMRRMFMKRTRM